MPPAEEEEEDGADEEVVCANWPLFQVLGLSLNLKKLLVDGMLAFCHIFWGITYHLKKAAQGVQFIWVELTRSKKPKASAFMKLKHAQPLFRGVPSWTSEFLDR